jgi:hypothetical protein
MDYFFNKLATVDIDHNEDSNPCKEKSMTSIKKHNETPNSNQLLNYS